MTGTHGPPRRTSSLARIPPQGDFPARTERRGSGHVRLTGPQVSRSSTRPRSPRSPRPPTDRRHWRRARPNSTRCAFAETSSSTDSPPSRNSHSSARSSASAGFVWPSPRRSNAAQRPRSTRPPQPSTSTSPGFWPRRVGTCTAASTVGSWNPAWSAPEMRSRSKAMPHARARQNRTDPALHDRAGQPADLQRHRRSLPAR